MVKIDSVEDYDLLIFRYLQRRMERWQLDEEMTPEQVIEQIKKGEWELDCPNLYFDELMTIPEECVMSSDGIMWDGNCIEPSYEEKVECGIGEKKCSSCQECWTVNYLLTRNKLDDFFTFWRLENEQN